MKNGLTQADYCKNNRLLKKKKKKLTLLPLLKWKIIPAPS